jgi:hypothetical protein
MLIPPFLWQASFYLVTITTEMVYIKHVVSTIGLKTWGLVYYNNIFALLLSPLFIILTGEGFGIAEVRIIPLALRLSNQRLLRRCVNTCLSG